MSTSPTSRRPRRSPTAARSTRAHRLGQLQQPARPVGRRHDRRLHLQLRLQQRRRLRDHRLASDSATVPATYLADGPGSRTINGPDQGQGRRLHRLHHHDHHPQCRADDHRGDRSARPGQRGQPDDGDRDGHRPGRRQRPLSYEFDCDNNGTYEVGPQAGNSTTCTFDDGPATDRTINVRVTDGDGGADTDSLDRRRSPTSRRPRRSPTAARSTRARPARSASATRPTSRADTTAGFTYSYDFDNDGTFEITDSACDARPSRPPTWPTARAAGPSTAGSRTRTAASPTTPRRSPPQCRADDHRGDRSADTGQRGQPDHGHRHRHRPGRRQRSAELRVRLRRRRHVRGRPQAGKSTTCTFDDGPATDRTDRRPGDRRRRRRRTPTASLVTSPTSPRRRRSPTAARSTRARPARSAFSDQADVSAADTTAGFTYSYDFNNDGTFEIADSPRDQRDRPGLLPRRRPGQPHRPRPDQRQGRRLHRLHHHDHDPQRRADGPLSAGPTRSTRAAPTTVHVHGPPTPAGADTSPASDSCRLRRRRHLRGR